MGLSGNVWSEELLRFSTRRAQTLLDETAAMDPEVGREPRISVRGFQGLGLT